MNYPRRAMNGSAVVSIETGSSGVCTDTTNPGSL